MVEPTAECTLELEDASGLLKQEMRLLGSLVMPAAEAHPVPAGKALAVDRTLFAQYITDRLRQNPLTELLRQEVTEACSYELQGSIYL